MMKLLIVDDEPIERAGLQAILRNGYPDLIIGQARNGRIAMEMVAEEQPDLILMDIKMPGMNGLEAVERIGGEYPDIRFIMVTAYDTFDYARQAIKLGVRDYLLKPSKAAEIIATVDKVLKEIEEERREREAGKRTRDTLTKMMPVVEADVVTQLLFDHVHEVHLDELLGLLGGETTKEVFVMLVILNASPSPGEFYACVKNKVRELAIGWAGAMSGRQIPIVVFRQTGLSYRAQAAQTVQQLLMLQRKVPGTDCFIGIGSAYESLEQIRLSYREALISSADTALPARHRFYSDSIALPGLSGQNSAKHTEKLLLEHIRLGQWEQAEEIVLQFIRQGEQNGTGLALVQQRVQESLWLVSRTLYELGIETESSLFSFRAQDYRQLRMETKCLLERMNQEMTEHQSRLEADTLQRIKQYIAEHFQKDITLEMISKEVKLSPFYISKLFKEQFGVNYIDFLTECRIEKAKSLMNRPDVPLKEIAFEAGYNDPNYFSKVFKKMCGVSPTEYRNRIFGKKV
ncbi:response regulator [Paenibacillus sp. sptzw28]|uniref:response regulator n=1 Tax=Paenibacillus sp. sptzw28 TaxID=715179 RepID=UPI001C6ECDE7|nr:response regulator [Paenibacillus sp. sptzw28]QYR21082.1 response regulator [Paenibacillus sp. sptzw28]